MLGKPKFVSLFAGIGGFDLGLESAGFECAGQVEINPFCLSVLEKHWPSVPKHNDVRTAVEWWQSEERPQVDVVCGGFPCQDISVAKADRKGLEGERSGLYWEALGFVVAVRPRIVLLENVEGLLSSNNGRDLAVIQATLAECGYPYLEWRVLDSQYFGVPQRRVRVFLVASARDPRLGPVLLEPEGRGRDLEAISKARQKAARAAAKCYDEGARDRDAGSPPADTDGVREAAGVPGWVDHLGETARTLTTSGQRGDGDTDSFVVAPPLAATLTHGGHSDDISPPGRRNEDDVNLAVPFNLRGREEGTRVELGYPETANTLRTPGGSMSHQYVAQMPAAQFGVDGPADFVVSAQQPAAAVESGPGFWTESEVAGTLRNRDYKDYGSTVIYDGPPKDDVVGLNDPASTLTAHIGHAYSSPRGDGSDNLVFHLPTSTLQGSVAGDDPTKRRGFRVDAEAAAGNQVIPVRDVINAITKNSASGVGPDDNEAQAGRLVVVAWGSNGSETARTLCRADASQRSPALCEPNLAVYAKYRNAQNSEDDEAWAPANTSRTLNLFENTDGRTPHAIITEVGVQPDGGCGCCPVDPAPDANRYGSMGNAVSVPVIRWIGGRLWDEVVAQQAEDLDADELEDIAV